MTPYRPEEIPALMAAYIETLVPNDRYRQLPTDAWREGEHPFQLERQESLSAHLAFSVDDSRSLDTAATCQLGEIRTAEPIQILFLFEIRPNNITPDYQAAKAACGHLFGHLVNPTPDFPKDITVIVPDGSELFSRGISGLFSADWLACAVNVTLIYNMSLEP